MNLLHSFFCFSFLFFGVSKAYRPFPELNDINSAGNKVLPEYKDYLDKITRNGTKYTQVEKEALKSKMYLEMKDRVDSFNINDGVSGAQLKVLSPDCARDFQRYVNGYIRGSYWAVTMLDATEFIGPGILDGNYLFEGSYFQCRRAREVITLNPNPVSGLYCLAYWYQYYAGIDEWVKRGNGICIPDTCTDKDAMELLRNYYPISIPFYADVAMHCERGVPDLSQDPSAIVAITILSLFGAFSLFATIYHFCRVQSQEANYPDDIQLNKNKNNSNDVEVSDKAQKRNQVASIKFSSELDTNEPRNDVELKAVHLFDTKDLEVACGQSNPVYFDEERNLDTVSERVDDSSEKQSMDSHSDSVSISDTGKESGFSWRKPMAEMNLCEKLLLAGSLYITVPLVVSSAQPKGAIRCLNGIRVLAFFWVVVGHTYALGMLSYPPTVENELEIIIKYTKPQFTKIIQLDISVDTFFILSSFLMTLSFLRKLDRTGGKLGWKGIALHYFHRWWRLTPTYMIVLMAIACLWHYWGEGPFMAEKFPDADSCKSAWWVNLLYINNFYFKSGWCMGWSWYLCVDWQLFCVAPIFMYLLWRWPIAGVVMNCLVIATGIGATFGLKYNIYSGKGGDDFTDVYIKPYTRCHTYFMGILLGFIFYKTNYKIKMPWFVVALGWFFAISMYGLVSYLPALTTCYENSVCGSWDALESAFYYTLNRIMWGLWICWLITACGMGYGGFVDSFLSWNYFGSLSKLTYLGYLVHPVFTFLYWYKSPVQRYFNDWDMLYALCGNLMLSYVVALVLCVTISAPLMGTMAVCLPDKKKQKKETS